jgi:hypothetical protein
MFLNLPVTYKKLVVFLTGKRMYTYKKELLSLDQNVFAGDTSYKGHLLNEKSRGYLSKVSSLCLIDIFSCDNLSSIPCFFGIV